MNAADRPNYQPLQLSTREREVLRCFADGLRRREVARALWIAPDTVAFHATNVRAKLGARTLAQAVAVACREGVLT